MRIDDRKVNGHVLVDAALDTGAITLRGGTQD